MKKTLTITRTDRHDGSQRELTVWPGAPTVRSLGAYHHRKPSEVFARLERGEQVDTASATYERTQSGKPPAAE